MEAIVVAVVGSAVKTAFELLFAATKKAYETAAMFPELHDNLSLTLETLKSLGPLIARLNQTGASSVSERFRKTMEDGKRLVEGCDHVSRGSLNIWEKRKYAKKIIHLENSLRGLWFHLHIQLEVNSAVMPSPTNANLVAQDQNQSLIPIGRKRHLAEMKMRLLSSNSPPMLVLTAPVGYGKTTLAIMFCRDQRVKEKFKDNIFFAIVSDQHSDLVVQELCQLDRFRLPASENGEIAAGQNPLLLILDDVPLGSESLLEKFNRINIPDYKILVTSRYHFPNFGSPYELPELTDEDARALFCHSAFLPDKRSDTKYNKGDFQEELTKIVNHCKKFPPALTTIGKSLCNEDIQRWKRKCTQLSEGSIFESEKSLQGLKSCLDDLINELAPIKDCFKDLGLFPKNQRVPVAALLDMWAELYEGSNDNVSITNLYDLTYRNLASLVVTWCKDMDGYYGEHFVIQRDMLKLLSIHESGEDPIGHRLVMDTRGDKLPPWWTKKKQKTKQQKTEEARLVSVSTGESSSEEWRGMDLPKGEVLVLNFQEKNYALPKFMKKMGKLKVLMVTNDGFSPAELSNFELLYSLSNLKRLRLERISIPLISKKWIQSKSVKKISLFLCNVRQAFGNSSIQIFETFPCLEELHIEYCDDLVELPAKLCDHRCLKVLIITNSHKLSALPEDIGNLKNLEVLRLRSCTGLEKLPVSIEKLGKLNFLDIYNCFSIKELPECIGKMKGLRKINMAKCSRLNVLPESLYDCDLDQQLTKVICDKDTRNLWEPFSLNPNKITVAKEEINLNWIPGLQN